MVLNKKMIKRPVGFTSTVTQKNTKRTIEIKQPQLAASGVIQTQTQTKGYDSTVYQSSLNND